jgi:REP element-mobilizing transposase RayT
MNGSKRPKRPVQLTLDQARRPTGHGGWRPGAGRPRSRTTCSHAARPAFAKALPLHVTLRVVGGLRSLRRERVVQAVREAIADHGDRDDFRVVHFNVLGNHLHFLVEAASARALARGMQGLNVRLVRRINAVLGRTGTLLAERYHSRPLGSPREVRNALRYVLLNGRHHAAERGQVLARGWVDPYSSALWFDGWNATIRTDAPWLRPLAKAGCPTAAPHTWLLKVGWRRGGGPIAVDEVPGPAP